MCRELYFVHLPTKIHPKGSIGHGAATEGYQSLRSGRRCSEMVRKGVGGSFTVGIVYYIVESLSAATFRQSDYFLADPRLGVLDRPSACRKPGSRIASEMILFTEIQLGVLDA